LIVDKQSDSAISKRKFRIGEVMFDKKKILSMLGILALIFFVCGVLELSAAPKKHLIVIDPAHGGQDKGIGLTDKVAEKDITLAVALVNP
jgi:N-acetylmuramoyl-L-alanine amidase